MKLKPYLPNGTLKLCCGCGQPFPVRAGNIEVLVGQDGQLYCYARAFECAALAARPVAMQRAA